MDDNYDNDKGHVGNDTDNDVGNDTDNDDGNIRLMTMPVILMIKSYSVKIWINYEITRSFLGLFRDDVVIVRDD